MTERIALFPLSAVLYPGLLLPLHIFEDRYRALVKDLMDQPEGTRRGFGVVAVGYGHDSGPSGALGREALHDIGCFAQLREAQVHADGSADIVTVGTERFVLGGVDTQDAWTSGEIELLDEPLGHDVEVLDAAVRQRLARYRLALARAAAGRPGDEGLTGLDEVLAEGFDLPTDSTTLSYLTATVLVVDLATKQELLAIPDTASRLRAELALLRSETRLLRGLGYPPATDFSAAPWSRN